MTIGRRDDVELANGEVALHALVGSSAVMQRLRERISEVARLGKDTFIQGESGTGKELVARAVHACARPGLPFVTLNGASLGQERAESDLFGNEAGAWTDARRAAPGLLQEAGRGTLFLDEVSTLAAAVQVKLLRLFEQREYRTVGGRHLLYFAGQFITATNEDLAAAVKREQFRGDLYGRVRRTPISVPPLRDRVDDIEELLDHHASLEGVAVRWTPGAISFLKSQPWPNNVRELFHVAEDAGAPRLTRPIDTDDLARCFDAAESTVQPSGPPSGIWSRASGSGTVGSHAPEIELRRALTGWLEGRPARPLARIAELVLDVAAELAQRDTREMAALLERPRRSVQHLLAAANRAANKRVSRSKDPSSEPLARQVGQ